MTFNHCLRVKRLYQDNLEKEYKKLDDLRKKILWHRIQII